MGPVGTVVRHVSFYQRVQLKLDLYLRKIKRADCSIPALGSNQFAPKPHSNAHQIRDLRLHQPRFLASLPGSICGVKQA